MGEINIEKNLESSLRNKTAVLYIILLYKACNRKKVGLGRGQTVSRLSIGLYCTEAGCNAAGTCVGS